VNPAGREQRGAAPGGKSTAGRPVPGFSPLAFSPLRPAAEGNPFANANPSLRRNRSRAGRGEGIDRAQIEFIPIKVF